MNNIKLNEEIRNLMNLYTRRYKELNKELKEARETNDMEAEITIEALKRQAKKMIAELFETMSKLDILDEEEIEMGTIK